MKTNLLEQLWLVETDAKSSDSRPINHGSIVSGIQMFGSADLNQLELFFIFTYHRKRYQF